jgi:hypothetical protein
MASYSYHSGLIEIVIASYIYRSSLIGYVIASYSYSVKVTQSLSLLIIMLLRGFTLTTTPGYFLSVVNPTGRASLRTGNMGEVIVTAL